MTNEQAETLEELLVDVEDRVESATGGDGGPELSEDDREELRRIAREGGDALERASLEDLLAAAGFTDLPEEIEPSDLPGIVARADPEPLVRLRKLLWLNRLEAAATGDDGELEERLATFPDADAADGDGGGGKEGTSLSGLLSEFLPDQDEEGEAEGDADESGDGEDADESGTGARDADEGEETDDESGLGSVSDLSDKLRGVTDALKSVSEGDERDEEGDEADESESEDEADEADAGGASSGVGGRGRSHVSTVPSSDRADMNAVRRYSTLRQGSRKKK
ncbi:hypothetical protein [Halegenticoccus tardaugens]|uniref:hypothetical protein n=1 Tax=Halegenticoccus tardaugens TaxID=2071624 RepID=UPI00100A7C5E|nr:hypothetical protein [Halegenticoccus tardaugens]